MDFIYKINSNKNEVSLLGIERECPNDLEIPECIEINGNKYKVTEIIFGSLFPQWEPLRGKGVTCEVLRIPNTVKKIVLANSNIIEVFLPESLIKIEWLSFYKCEKLKKVHLPNGLISIGTSAFKGCVNLEEIIIPPTVIEIGSHCFENCSSLKEIIIPIGVTTLNDGLFKNCYNLWKVTTENDDVTFCSGTYQGCRNLQSVSNHLIEDGLLYNIEKTELYTYLKIDQNKGHIIVPPTVKKLGCGFASSTEIISIDLSKTQIETIYQETFKDCLNLQKVLLPNSIKIIEGRAFDGCLKLSEINLPNSIEYIGIACFYNCALKEIVFSNRLKEIPQTAFCGCKELVRIDIPLSIKKIDTSAFRGCDNIKLVVMPKGFNKSLSKIFPQRNKIEFIFSDAYRSRIIRTEAYTYGRFSPCPYCGSNDVNTFCDGTAKCNSCDGEYTYQR